MKKAKHKYMYSLLAIMCVINVVLVGGILAYLTATDSKINKFVMGDIKIKIHEDNFIPTLDTDEDGEPDAVVTYLGNVTPKNPQIENVGENLAYVYFKVVVPNRDYCVGATEIQKGDIFEYIVNDEHWKELPDSRSTDGGNNVYIYYYDEILPVPTGDEPVITTPLFNSMNLKENVRNLGDDALEVGLYAYAIQAYGLPDRVNVLNTEWAEQFKSEAISKPYLYNVIEHTSLEDCILSFESLELDEGEFDQIIITKLLDATAKIEPVTYSSSKEHVATVDSDGNITAVGRGKAIITITGEISGFTKTVEVNINGEVTLEECNVTVANSVMDEGEVQQVIVENLVDDSLEVEELTYSSSNPDVASVDENGNITAGVGGKVVITVTGNKTGLEKTITIDVLANLGNVNTSNLGAYVDLNTNILSLNTLTFADNSKPLEDWRVFLQEENGTWLVLASYMPYAKLPSGVALTKSTSPYCVKGSSRANLLSGLRDETNWKTLLSSNTSLYNNQDVKVKGASTLQEWVASWNANSDYTTITISGNESNGYKVNNSYNFDLSSNIGYNDTLYFPHKSAVSSCNGSWLASPSANESSVVMSMRYSGHVNYNYYYFTNVGLRPVVYIPNNINE